MAKWARGSRAKFVCQRCGQTAKHLDRKVELSGVHVCPECYDGDFQILNHPANFPAPIRPDAPLKNPFPEAPMDVPTSLGYNTWDVTPYRGE
jgi:NAD-dependent SIR2 family protein deacetylase